MVATANYTILDNIGHQRRVRIESYRPDGILRFIAERENSEQAITDLERAIRRFQSLSLNLNDFESLRQRRGLQKLSDFFSERDLEVTSRLSGTVLDASLDSQVNMQKKNWFDVFLVADRTIAVDPWHRPDSC